MDSINSKNNTFGTSDDYSEVSPIISIKREKADEDNYGFSGTLEQSGWYYDQQMAQPLTSVRLFANTIASWNKKGYWEYEKLKRNKYEQLLASSILSEDFSIDISNNWEDNAVGDAIGGFLNSFKVATPYLGDVQSALRQMSASQTIKKRAAEEGGLKIAKTLANLVDYFGATGSNGDELLTQLRKVSNGSFMAQGCSFTYYNGTGVNFGNLGMKYTIFPAYKNGEWVSVIDQLIGLLPYGMGTLQEVDKDLAKAVGATTTDVAEKIDNKLGTSIKDFLGTVSGKLDETEIADTASELINEYIKWQAPPAGYDIDTPRNMDKIIPGTLCLEIGAHYKIEGLVISNLSFQLSKQMVRDPKYFVYKKQPDTDTENAISPLYCEVNLMLRPVTKYSSVSLGKFIKGNKLVRQKEADEILNTLDTKINKQMTETT